MTKTLREMRAELEELKAKGRAIIDAADKAGRDLTEAEDADLAAIEAKVDTLKADVASAEERQARRAALAASSMPVVDVGSIRIGADRIDRDPAGGFASMAEFAHRVQQACIQGNVPDPRLHQAAAGSMRETGGTDGFLVPPEYRDRISELIHEQDDFIDQLDIEPTTSNHVHDLYSSDTPWGGQGIVAYWREEGAPMSATKPTQDPRGVQLHQLYAFVRSSEELLQDAPRLQSRLERKSAEAINWKIHDAVINGNGVGKPLGWMNSGALITVAKESSQAADTIVGMNVANMFARMHGGSIQRAVWYVNSATFPQLVNMQIAGQPAWVANSQALVNAPGGLLLGRPVRFSEHNKALGDKGDIMFVDLKGYYALRKSTGMQFASSMHLYFDTAEMAFRWMFRFGGQPHLAAPVAPANGTDSKSHFVTLAERA